MATNVKISLDKRRSKKDETYPIILRISHLRSTISIPTGYYVREKDWDEKGAKIKNSYKGVSSVTRLNNLIRKQQVKALDIITQLQDSVELNKLTAKQIKERIVNKDSQYTFYKFTDMVIQEFKESKRFSYASSIKDMLNAVKRFKNDVDFKFEQLDYSFLKSFEAQHRNKGNSINSLGVYMRNIRVIYNRAIKEGHVKRDFYPFKDYSIKREKTKKRAVTRDFIKSIEDLELTEGTRIWHARNYFLFSFYAMGINFIDMAFLRPNNFSNGRLEYKRHKTNKAYSIEITQQMNGILSHYLEGKNHDEYIFPIITRVGDSVLEFRDIAQRRRVYNKKLKEIGEMIGMETPLTSYVARHSWATIAKRKGVPVAVISEGMGHEDVKTTQIYLDSFNKDVLDDYNKLITQ